MRYGMSKKNLKIIVISTLFFIIIFSVFAYLIKSSGKTSINPKISAIRIIVVDKNLTILQIISGTKKDIEPTVRLESKNGMEISLTDFVSKQYLKLKSTVDFSKNGVVYDRRYVSFFGILLPDNLQQIIYISRDILAAFSSNK